MKKDEKSEAEKALEMTGLEYLVEEDRRKAAEERREKKRAKQSFWIAIISTVLAAIAIILSVLWHYNII